MKNIEITKNKDGLWEIYIDKQSYMTFSKLSWALQAIEDKEKNEEIYKNGSRLSEIIKVVGFEDKKNQEVKNKIINRLISSNSSFKLSIYLLNAPRQ